MREPNETSAQLANLLKELECDNFAVLAEHRR